MFIFSPALRIWCRFSSPTAAGSRITPCRVTLSSAIALASRGCSPVLSDGPTRQQKRSIGAPSLATTSPLFTVRQQRAASPIPAIPRQVFTWLICESYDDKGNAIVYEYAAENDDKLDRSTANERNRLRTANRYLKRIRYGNRDLAPRSRHRPDADRVAVRGGLRLRRGPLRGDRTSTRGRPEAEQHRFVRASASPRSPGPFARTPSPHIAPDLKCALIAGVIAC